MNPKVMRITQSCYRSILRLNLRIEISLEPGWEGIWGENGYTLLELDPEKKSPDTPGSPEGNTEGPGTASSEPLLPS